MSSLVSLRLYKRLRQALAKKSFGRWALLTKPSLAPHVVGVNMSDRHWSASALLRRVFDAHSREQDPAVVARLQSDGFGALRELETINHHWVRVPFLCVAICCLYVYVCMYVCMYVCIYVCMYE
jgi:hypothetical protein